MSFKKPILNLFPKHVNLTEISIISFYELIVYLLIFFGIYRLYSSWIQIPVRTIEIECERIDTLDFQIFPSYYRDYIFLNDDTTANIISTINLTFTLSNLFKNDYNISTHNDFQTKYDTDTIRNVPISFKKHAGEYTKEYIDSLRKEYYQCCDRLGQKYPNRPHYYQKIEGSQKTIRLFSNSDNQEATFDSIAGTNAYISRTTLFKDSEGHKKTRYEYMGIDDSFTRIKDQGGAFDKPNILDPFDLSQCYYVFKIKTLNIEKINLNLSFTGANEFIYVKKTPIEKDAQTLYYQFRLFEDLSIKNPTPKKVVQGYTEMVLHVKSKELENMQNSRMFAITAVLSGLIVIFLTFLVIFLYRFSSWFNEKRKCKKRLPESEKSISDETKSTETSLENESFDEEQIGQEQNEGISTNNA